MTLALQDNFLPGLSRMIGIVESRNFDWQSGYRMGYDDFGKVYVLKAFGHYFLHHTESCRDFEVPFQLKSVAAARTLEAEKDGRLAGC